jgi:hypothetical protein
MLTRKNITLLISVSLLPWAPRICGHIQIHIESAQVVTSRGYILGVHMDEGTLLK